MYHIVLNFSETVSLDEEQLSCTRFDGVNTLIIGYARKESVQQCCFTRTGSSGNHKTDAVSNAHLEKCHYFFIRHSAFNEAFTVNPLRMQKTDRNRNTAIIIHNIRLTELIPELLQLVDESRIAFRPAVELSYLKKEEQTALLEEISYTDATPSLAQAIKMKKFSNEGKLEYRVLYRYKIKRNLYHGGRFTIEGEFVKENTMSEDLREKLLRGGVPGPLLERFMGKEMIA